MRSEPRSAALPFRSCGPILGLLVGIALAVSGCDSTEDVSSTQFSPDLVAATAPDSIAAGGPLEVIVHWRRTNTCQSLHDVQFSALNDSFFTLTVLGLERRGSNANCIEETTLQTAAFRLDSPPARRFTLEVFGASQRFVFEIEGGTAPAALERHRIYVRNSTNLQDVENASVTIAGSAGDTLAVLLTGSDGVADTTLACPAAGTRAYRLEVLGPVGRSAILDFLDHPARCGIPQHTRVSL